MWVGTHAACTAELVPLCRPIHVEDVFSNLVSAAHSVKGLM